MTGKLTWLLAFVLVGGGVTLAGIMAELRAGRYEEAIPMLIEARERFPEQRADLSYNLAMAYLALDSFAQARDAFFQAQSPLAPHTASLASNQLGLLLLAEGRPREALSAFREALLFSPDHDDARYNYELLALKLGQTPPPKSGTPPSQQQQDSPPPPPGSASRSLDPELQELLNKLQQRQRQVVPPGDKASAIGADTLSLAQALQVLDLMRQQERQYVQQLRKVSSAATQREGRPHW